MHNRLAQYLEEVLLQHECVTLPSIGGFILEHCPATWDKERHVAYAPHVAIRFNESLGHHDGILIEQYALNGGISLRRAKLELEKDIQQLKQELLRTHHYRLNGIGILSLGANGLMEFTPAPSPMILHAYYGLSSVLVPQFDAYREVENKALSTEEYIQIRIPRRGLYYGVVAVVMGFIVGLPLAVWHPSAPSFQASIAPSKDAVSNIVKSVQAEVNVATGNVEVAPTELAEDNLWVSPEKGSYYLIIGTERSQSVAEGYIKLYRDKYPNMRILTTKKMYRISAGTFTTKADAYAEQQALTKAGVSSWIYIP